MTLPTYFDAAALAWAQEAVREAQRRFPQICPNGIHWYTPERPETWTDDDYAMVCLCRWYFTQAQPIKSKGVSSYYLKHRIEEHFMVGDRGSYVHNGSCIVAAMAMDFPVTTKHFNRLNASIGISKRSIDHLEQFTEQVIEHPLARR
jgi:hypothetical protein